MRPPPLGHALHPADNYPNQVPEWPYPAAHHPYPGRPLSDETRLIDGLAEALRSKWCYRLSCRAASTPCVGVRTHL